MSLPCRPAALVGLGLAASLTFGACSSSGSGASSAGQAPAAAAPGLSQSGAAGGSAAGPGADPNASPAAPSVAPDAAKSAAGSNGSAASAAADAAGDKLVRTASLEVQVADVQARTADVRRIAVAAGGSVTSENSSAVPRASDGSVDPEASRSTLSLSVPADTLDRVLDDLGKLGTTVQRTSSSRDVTSTYVDTQSRVATMKASLDQLRALLAKATTIEQLITLETELSRRQADLDSLQAQLASLDKKVAVSTVTISLLTAATVVVPQDDGSGFLGGLRHGWRAFLDTSGAVLTVLGAVLPFVAVVAIVGGPVLLWWRRRRGATAPAWQGIPAAVASASEPPAPQPQPSEPGQPERQEATAEPAAQST